MESSFHFMSFITLSKIGNVVYIAFLYLVFQFLIVHMVFILPMNCTVVK